MTLTLPRPPDDADWTLQARWVFPADAPPAPGGQVTVRGDRIVRAGPRDRAADVDLGNAAVLPGFVNAHTHLDLTALHGRCPPTPDFPAWLRSVRQARHALGPDDLRRSIDDGIAQCLRTGTTLVGDIAAFGASFEALASAPLRSVVFYELLGLTRERAAVARENLTAWLARARATDCCRRGVSPHAPYSVRRELFAHVAGQHDLPVALHFAESRAELELLADRAGPFVDFLREVGVWDPEGLVAGPEEVAALFATGAPVMLVHGNYLPRDLRIAPNQTVVYCPRTHAAFGHDRHPLRDLLARGARVALGTDSLASNPDLDILAEARFVHARYPDVPGDVLLRMLTLHGAEALGWAGETGSLAPGKSADLVVLPLPDADEADPHELLWASSHGAAAILFRGRWRG